MFKQNLLNLVNQKFNNQSVFLFISALLIHFIFITQVFPENSPKSSIGGQIITPQGKPIPGVFVKLAESNNTTISDENGQFLLNNLPKGVYQIKFEHIGYQSKEIKNIHVGDNENIKIDNVILNPQIYQDQGTIVTATRAVRQITDISNAINLVSDLEIKKRQAKTSAEALREENGVFVQKTGHGGGSAIIRGLSSNQILLMIDGIRLNNSTYRLGNHQYLTTVDNQMLEQIEVVRGPTSVLYGSDALGGTINLITQSPDFTSKNSLLKYRIFGRVASADNERTLHSSFSLNQSKIDLQAGFSYKKYGDLRRGGNSQHHRIEKSTNGLKQTPTGFDAYAFNSKLIYDISPTQLFTFSYQINRKDKVPRYDKYENDNYYKWYYNPQDRDLAYAVYKQDIQSKYFNSWRVSFSFHRQKEGRETQKDIESLLTENRYEVQTKGVTFQLNSHFNNQIITFGAEAYLDDVSSERFSINTKTGVRHKEARARYPNGANYNSFGVFLEDEIHLSSDWMLRAGSRFSYFNTSFKIPPDTSAPGIGDIEENFKALTFNFGAIHKLTDYFYLNANIAQGFRAPNLSDLSKLGESKGNFYEVPNPDLDPEQMLSFDGGIKISSNLLQASLSFYHSRINNLLASANTLYRGNPFIVFNADTFFTKSKQNIGTAYISGIESSANFHINQNMSIYTNFTYTYGQNITRDEPVGGIPPIFGLTGVNWQQKNLNLNMIIRYAGKQDRLSADDRDDPRIPTGGTPGWYIINLRTGYKLNHFANIKFAIENMLDYNYREHGSGINGPGRNFIFSLELHH